MQQEKQKPKHIRRNSNSQGSRKRNKNRNQIVTWERARSHERTSRRSWIRGQAGQMGCRSSQSAHKGALPDTTRCRPEKHLSRLCRRRCGLLENAQISSDPAFNSKWGTLRAGRVWKGDQLGLPSPCLVGDGAQVSLEPGGAHYLNRIKCVWSNLDEIRKSGRGTCPANDFNFIRLSLISGAAGDNAWRGTGASAPPLPRSIVSSCCRALPLLGVHLQMRRTTEKKLNWTEQADALLCHSMCRERVACTERKRQSDEGFGLVRRGSLRRGVSVWEIYQGSREVFAA